MLSPTFGRRKPDVKRRTRKAEWKRDEKERAVSNVLKEIGKEVGTEHITAGSEFVYSSFRTTSSPILCTQSPLRTLCTKRPMSSPSSAAAKSSICSPTWTR